MNINDEDDGPLVSRYKAEQLEGGAFADVEEARMETFIYVLSWPLALWPKARKGHDC